MAELRKYGVATTVLFPLIGFGVTDLTTVATFAAGDTKIIKDEGAAANTTNAPVHEGNGIYSVVLTATEMQAARVVVTVIDQTVPKVWEDQAFFVDAYGHASAQHAFDLDDAQPTVDLAPDAISAAAVSTAGAQEIADEILRRGLSSVEPSPGARTVYAALASLVNRVRINGTNLEIYETNDSTIIASIPITTSATQAPITELDPP